MEAQGLEIAPAAVAEIEAAAGINALFDEYAAESLIDGLPAPVANWQAYRALEAAGIIFIDEDETGGVGVRIAKSKADKSRKRRMS